MIRDNGYHYLKKDESTDIYLNCIFVNNNENYSPKFASIIVYQDLYNNVYYDFFTLNISSDKNNTKGFEYGYFKEKIENVRGINDFVFDINSRRIVKEVIAGYKKRYK